jgi:hypothetical protein
MRKRTFLYPASAWAGYDFLALQEDMFVALEFIAGADELHGQSGFSNASRPDKQQAPSLASQACGMQKGSVGTVTDRIFEQQDMKKFERSNGSQHFLEYDAVAHDPQTISVGFNGDKHVPRSQLSYFRCATKIFKCAAYGAINRL